MNRRIDSRRAGFSLIELLTTMVILGTLAGIAVPSFRDSVAKADARKIMTDVAAIRTALFEYREDAGALPPTAPWGRVPDGLSAYLNGVDFAYKDVTYRMVARPRRGRVDLVVRYPRNGPIAGALRVFDRPGNDSGSATWRRARMRFRLLEDNR